MKKMFFSICFFYVFSLIVAIYLLIFKSESSEISYLIARLLFFEYSVLTGMLFFYSKIYNRVIKEDFQEQCCYS